MVIAEQLLIPGCRVKHDSSEIEGEPKSVFFYDTRPPSVEVAVYGSDMEQPHMVRRVRATFEVNLSGVHPI